MTDKDIIKALECCNVETDCKRCPLYKEHFTQCIDIACKNALDLITRQQAEIERLKTELDFAKAFRKETDAEFSLMRRKYGNMLKAAKSEAYKEFAERLKNEIISDTAYGCDTSQHTGYYDYQIKIGDIPEYIDNLLKEMEKEDA